MKRLAKLLLRLVYVVIFLVLACSAAVFLFPEWCVRTLVMHLVPGVQCSVDKVHLQLTRVGMRGIHLVTASATVDVVHAVVERRDDRWLLMVNSGEVVLVTAPTSHVAHAAGTSSWSTLPVFALAVPVCVSMSNVMIRVQPQASLPAIAALCHLDAIADARMQTQVWAAVTICLPGPSNGDVRVCLWQAGNDTGIELPAAACNPALLLTPTPEWPWIVKHGAAQVSASGVASPVRGTSSLVRASCDLGAAAQSVECPPRMIVFNNPRVTGSAWLKHTLSLPYVPRDPLGYLLARFDAAVTARVDGVRAGNILISNVLAVVFVVSNRIELADIQFETCGGTIACTGTFDRYKVKGQDAYNLFYSGSMSITNIGASQLRHMFRIDTNGVDGVFNGTMSAAGFDRRVTSLSGSFKSSGPGVVLFPAAQKYVTAMGEDMKKDMAELTIRRVREYLYRNIAYTPQDTPAVDR